MNYTAEIEYTPDNIRKLSRAVNNAFRFNLKVLYLIICIGLIVFGVVIGMNSLTGVVCIAFGCFLIPSVNAMEKNRASRLIRQLNGRVIRVRYQFSESGFSCFDSKENKNVEYGSIIRLLDAGDDLYLFPNSNQAYMLDKHSIVPRGEAGFKEFIADHVGLEWTYPMSLLTLNLKKLKFIRQNTRMR